MQRLRLGLTLGSGWFALGLLALAGASACSAKMKMASAPGASASGPMGAPASSPMSASESAESEMAAAPDESGAEAVLAVEPTRPRPGQLTAGVWDDNLNFAFFDNYAQRAGQSSADLRIFSLAEQRAARASFEQRRPRRELDVQLVLDTTGSMGDELAYLQSEFDSIATEVVRRFPGMEPRWSLVVYRDRGDEYVTRRFAFTADVGDYQRKLAQQHAAGGGDIPEAVPQALAEGLAEGWRPGPDVARVAFWVADAPPHPGEGARFANVVRHARERGVHIYPVASSGIDDGTEYQMRAAAQLTGGRYLFLTDDSGIGNAHADPHVPCYQVTQLDRAVVRMIESELRGQHVAAPPQDIVRQVGSPNSQGRCRVGDILAVAY